MNLDVDVDVTATAYLDSNMDVALDVALVMNADAHTVPATNEWITLIADMNKCECGCP